jgi:hydroxymethylpyrimidine/phosphomethylpyrimidine kinase/superfamily II DNA or RNA helicase
MPKNKIVRSNCLATTHREIAQQWHPTKNGELTPDTIGAGSPKKVWWICDKGDEHEWEASIAHRTKKNGSGCPVCSNQKIVRSNCLATTHREIAQQWHPTKNGELTPDTIGAGSGKKVWWLCDKGDEHEWEANVTDRTRIKGSGCPVCSNDKIVRSNCLATTHREIAQQWHPTKNGELTPDTIGAGSSKKVWWICDKGDEHEWKASIQNRTKKNGTGCPVCSNYKIVRSNCLATTHREIAQQWHPTKNGELTPDTIGAGSHKKVWWLCDKGDEHEWEANVVSRTRIKGSGCPVCSNDKIVRSNCLATTHREIAQQWHPTKNGELTPDTIGAGSNKKVWWICDKGDEHEWEAIVVSRTRTNGTGCPVCSNDKIVRSNCLATTHREIAQQWHPTKNGELTPDTIGAGSDKKVWWICDKGDEHEWKANIVSRTKKNGTGCPFCNSGWTIENIKLFIKSLLPNIDSLTPAELYVLFQQSGIISSTSKAKAFIKIVKTGRFPKEELEKFVSGEKSVVDNFISIEKNDSINPTEIDEIEEAISEKNLSLNDEDLPVIETKDILSTVDNTLIANSDQEAVEFFIDSSIAKIWKHVFLNEDHALEQLNFYKPGVYSTQVKNKFLEQYNGAKNLVLPKGYSFSSGDNLLLPNLMQKYTAFLIKQRKRIGNWSGTGAGKTLSAILSSRVIDAKLTLICCPNNVVSSWVTVIKSIYPDSITHTKTLDIEFIDNRHHYLILNYEFFQQAKSENKLKKFIVSNNINFIVIDEIHYSKQRVEKKISKRKQVISAMLSEVMQNNPNLHVLGMSATPVINNLFEGKTLIELITGVSHDDINIYPTISNCVALYQKMVVHGIRWMPPYSQKLHVKTIKVDCSTHINEIKAIANSGTMVDLEAILTQYKLPKILENIKPKTIIYTHFLKNIMGQLQEAVEKKGWSVSVYSGEDKTGLESFLKGNTDVLIATSCLATGVDGLQFVCNRIIINILPWTHAEFEQLRGRIYRQGQKEDHVDIIVPLTYAYVNDNRWSYCDSRWKRIQFKKSIGDAAVDGVIPEGNLRSPTQAYQDAINWLKNLDAGQINEIERQKITLDLLQNKRSG